jgi:hypothetical protein
MEGYLMKHRGKKGWQKRWISISQGVLLYSKSAHSPLLHNIPLEGANVAEENSRNVSHGFQVMTADQMILLRAGDALYSCMPHVGVHTARGLLVHAHVGSFDVYKRVLLSQGCNFVQNSPVIALLLSFSAFDFPLLAGLIRSRSRSSAIADGSMFVPHPSSQHFLPIQSALSAPSSQHLLPNQ